jgi:hypothetical protein
VGYARLQRRLIVTAVVIIICAISATFVPFILVASAGSSHVPLRCFQYQPNIDTQATLSKEAHDFSSAAAYEAGDPRYFVIGPAPQPLAVSARSSILYIQLPRRRDRMSVVYDAGEYAQLWDNIYFSNHGPFTLCTTVAIVYRAEPTKVWYSQLFLHGQQPVVKGPYDLPFEPFQ